MKTRNVIRVFSLAAMMSMAFTSCNNAPQAGTTGAEEGSADPSGAKVAYVEIDSLMSQYNFCKDYTLILQKKSNNARNTLNQKGKTLQNAVNSFQQKLNNNGFASREEAEKLQANIQRQEQSLQELQQRLATELDAETMKYNVALRDSLQNFLNEYNADKRFDYILSKAGDNILYANKAYDITNDVVNGLNKKYKSIVKEEEK